MRHAKNTLKLNRTSSHRRCLFANLLKSLIEHERIQTTLPKAKELRKHADRLITLGKKNTLATRRRAISKLMISYNKITPKQARIVREKKKNISVDAPTLKETDIKFYNTDRKVINKLFNILAPRFADREGGYTRIIRKQSRIGDDASQCFIEYIQ
ncbi:MAG: 50S ribosomal protein L17 [Chlamydiales bacterium]